MPCRIAFSTSGCKIRFGTVAVRTAGFDIHSDRQPIVKARLLDLQIVIQKLEFFS